MGYCKMTLTLDLDKDFKDHKLDANYNRDRNYSKQKFISSFLFSKFDGLRA